MARFKPAASKSRRMERAAFLTSMSKSALKSCPIHRHILTEEPHHVREVNLRQGRLCRVGFERPPSPHGERVDVTGTRGRARREPSSFPSDLHVRQQLAQRLV